MIDACTNVHTMTFTCSKALNVLAEGLKFVSILSSYVTKARLILTLAHNSDEHMCDNPCSYSSCKTVVAVVLHLD